MYIAIDGDAVGKKLEQLILEEDLEGLKDFSQYVRNTTLRFQQIIEDNRGKIYMSGGDNIFAVCTNECAQMVASFARIESEKSTIRYSVSVGENIRDVYMALSYAKCNQKYYVEAHRDGENLTFTS